MQIPLFRIYHFFYTSDVWGVSLFISLSLPLISFSCLSLYYYPRFGQGPHYVEMEIEYPEYQSTILESTNWPRARGIVRYEMASLDLMPVAVNLFLQQVHHGLWDGCSFVVNAVHIIQAGPHRHNGQGGYDHNIPELYDRFISNKLDVMPFQEYSTDYPHVKHTLGFSGRPSGPDFYINKIDNSVSHGPGGQEHHNLHEEADPCFAKVVSGGQILEDIYKIPTYSRDVGFGNLIVNPVIILNAKVISSNTNHELHTLLNDEQSMQEVERPRDVNNNDNEEQQSELVEQQQQQQAVEQPLQEEVERPHDENNNNNNNYNEEQHSRIVEEQQPQQHAVEQALQEELELSREQQQQQ